mmetsp:Transcript_19729/g.44806  ORF Transcript_19729/g.44806 Transcript_19729/m.44806 type:complete len:92 (-) Transcript_19729:619-894(-)|eukprot:CAMPEP_0113320396 /NCGR_PEP_ID=MMETSP0010_2-20120614/14231_1 /TAXON_ID=216773 ORGANISM="Corethron hystrix, Strain 308" /NCGR_SAMPLE_ID=MMETSP0010_2 /ASSEMBLY_ACC=CAM_ASM_000155 /LENGTH=91 /DNA_ID=CAMNT_0000178189 /DNA_START=39 /DNA_END=314 /DNA_ORIENTATION=+ /assembly_acc=CAM_ASM_000155
MSVIYEEVELEDMEYNSKTQTYTYPCPCGDIFYILLEDMVEVGEDIATCPSCTLRIRVIYDDEDLPELREESSSGSSSDSDCEEDSKRRME